MKEQETGEGDTGARKERREGSEYTKQKSLIEEPLQTNKKTNLSICGPFQNIERRGPRERAQ